MWHKRWSETHVDKTQHDVCEEWLMGLGEGQVANNTKVKWELNPNKPPYHRFNRYRVECVEKAS